MLKRLTKQILPPFLLNLIRKKKAPHVYQGIFFSIEEIKKNIQTSDYVDYTQDLKDAEILLNRKLEFNFRESFLPIFLAQNSTSINYILDIGAGCFPVTNFLKYSIGFQGKVAAFDRPQLVSIIKDRIIENDTHWFDDIQQLSKHKFDLVYFGSSLQYFDDLEQLFSIILSSKTKFLVICETSFLETHKSCFTLQINMPPSVFPQKLNNINQLTDKMKKFGFQLIFKSKRPAPTHDQFSSSEIYRRDLIFKKVKSS